MAIINFRAEEFDLETEKIPSRKLKVLREMKLDEVFGKETRWPFMSKRGKVTGTIPIYPAVVLQPLTPVLTF